MKKRRTETAETEQQLGALEEHLAGTLKPITPPSDLIARMRERIRYPQKEEIVSRLGDWRRLFWVYMGVMSSFLAVVTIARAFYYFMSRK